MSRSENNAHRPALVVRLRNFIGDVVLMIPALERLQAAGYALHCVGKPWARELLAAHGWVVTQYPKKLTARVATLKALRLEILRREVAPPPRGIDAITFATSFSSAMDMRFAGLKPFGYAVEGRSVFLKASAPIVYGEHAMHSYWRLAGALLGDEQPPPSHATLKVGESALAAARKATHTAGVAPGYVVAVPFAGGTFEKLDKKWPHFALFIERFCEETGRDVVLAPGPDEVEFARARFPRAKLLPNLALDTYAALMQDAALTVSNDTGPGHMAASVGARLLSVLGPTKAEQWGALGPRVRVIQDLPPRDGQWPDVDHVLQEVERILRSETSPE